MEGTTQARRHLIPFVLTTAFVLLAAALLDWIGAFPDDVTEEEA